MFQFREAYDAPIIRPRLAAARQTRVGTEPDVWVVVSTVESRDPATLDGKQDLAVGDRVRFTLQYGIKPKDDDSNLVSGYGTIVTPRTPLLPDSYGVRFDAVRKSHKLDPSVSPPFAGQVFLVAPWSIAGVEPKEKSTEAIDGPPGGSDVADWKPSLGEDVATSTVKPEEFSGTAPAAEPPPKSDGKSFVISAGLAAVIVLGLVLFYRTVVV